MKTKILLKARWLLCGLLAVFLTTNVWADEVTYTFNSKSWGATSGGSAANWTSGKDGAGFSNNGVQVTTDATGANATSPASFDNISKIVVTYNTNKSKGAGSLGIQIGSNDAVSQNWKYSGSADGTSANFTLQYDYETPQTGSVKITANTNTNSIYVVSIAITYTPAGGDEPAATLSSIEVSGELSDKTYENTDRIDLTGLVVTGKYSDNSTDNVTANATWEVRTDGTSESFTPSTYELTAGQTSVQVRATVDDKQSDWVIINYLTVTAHVATPGEHTINLNNAFYGVAAGNNPEEQSATQNDITVVSGCTSSATSKTNYQSTHIRYYANS
ncbi:MAG: hypothetical protein IJT35_08900 [Paludibacteraceae bacterium]|nr:hypothetical protein [Paludibacteraceae bacterium]